MGDEVSGYSLSSADLTYVSCTSSQPIHNGSSVQSFNNIPSGANNIDTQTVIRDPELYKMTSGMKPSIPSPNTATNPEKDFYCKVRMDSLLKLKDSTRTLLYLLEEIQSKTHNMPKENSQNILSCLKSLPRTSTGSDISASDIINSVNMKSLELRTKNLEEIYIKTEADDCSIFKRLTRQCHCLNNDHYNNFVIHFNEDTKYFTSTLGEIIKNIRILKKFLYMGFGYTSNALMFLVEGLTCCPHNERVEIAQACAHSDICNVFDEQSIVYFCISCPKRNNKDNWADVNTQNLTSKLLFSLSQIEEGRRYLNFSSKITNEIKRVLRKDQSKLTDTTLEYLNSTLNLLNPPLTKHINVTYYCKAEQGIGYRTLIALNKYHTHMTMEEIATNLDLLQNLSEHKGGKRELIQNLPSIILAFRQLIIDYDDPDINGPITNILNNLFSNDVSGEESEREIIPTYTARDTTTEPIPVLCAVNQVPSMKKHKKGYKTKIASNKVFVAPSRKGIIDEIILNTPKKKVPEDSKVIKKIKNIDSLAKLKEKLDYNATMRKLNLSRKF